MLLAGSDVVMCSKWLYSYHVLVDVMGAHALLSLVDAHAL